jgi:hypothetical protein
MDATLKSHMLCLHHQVPSIMSLGMLLVYLSLENIYIISVCTYKILIHAAVI